MDRRYFVAFAGVDSKGRPRAERMCVCVCVCVCVTSVFITTSMQRVKTRSVDPRLGKGTSF